MPLLCEPTKLPGVLVFTPQVFSDPRGYFLETFHQAKYSENGMKATMVQNNFSHSARGILRGLHYQFRHPQAKLVLVIRGEIFDVAVDIRRGSPTFGQWVGHVLSGANHRQLLIPVGFAHGFCVLSEEADVLYHCSDFYRADDEHGILWSDPAIGIEWPLHGDPILSGRDKEHPALAGADPVRLPVYEGD